VKLLILGIITLVELIDFILAAVSVPQISQCYLEFYAHWGCEVWSQTWSALPSLCSIAKCGIPAGLQCPLLLLYTFDNAP